MILVPGWWVSNKILGEGGGAIACDMRGGGGVIAIFFFCEVGSGEALNIFLTLTT